MPTTKPTAQPYPRFMRPINVVRRKPPIGFAPWPPARYGEVIWDDETFAEQAARLAPLLDGDDDDDEGGI